MEDVNHPFASFAMFIMPHAIELLTFLQLAWKRKVSSATSSNMQHAYYIKMLQICMR